MTLREGLSGDPEKQGMGLAHSSCIAGRAVERAGGAGLVGGIAVGLWVSVWASDGPAHGWRRIRVPGVAVEHMGLAEWTLL